MISHWNTNDCSTVESTKLVSASPVLEIDYSGYRGRRTKDFWEDQKAEGPKNLIVLEVKGTKQLGGHTKFKKQEEDIN